MADGDGLRILVVEDEALVVMMLEDILTELGHEIVGSAPTVAKALALIEGRGAVIDVAVLDANLAGESVAPVATVLTRRGVPYLVASGYEGAELRAFGVSGPTLRKPYRKVDMAAALAALRKNRGDGG